MDINGDGKDDIIQQWSNNNYISFVSYISEGDGNFRTVTTGTSTSGSALYIMAMDINGDGKSDLLNVISSSSSVELMAFLSYGDGTFAIKVSAYPISTNNVKFISMDVTNDGKQDLVQVAHLADGRTGIETYISNGDGTFAINIDTLSGPTSTWSYTFSGYALYGDISYGVKTNRKQKEIPVVGIIEEGSGTKYACYLSKGDGSYTYRNETHSTPSSTGTFLMTDLNGDVYSDAVKLASYSTCCNPSMVNGVVLWSYLAQGVSSFKTGISTTFTLANPAFNSYSDTRYNRYIALKNC
eukprot:gene30989-41253_t